MGGERREREREVSPLSRWGAENLCETMTLINWGHIASRELIEGICGECPKFAHAMPLSCYYLSDVQTEKIIMTRVEPVEYGHGNYVEHSARRGKLEKGRTRRSIVIWAPAVLQNFWHQ